MEQRNCPNCGAAYEIDKNKCPYCGTSYFDMTSINFNSNEPIYLKIKTNDNTFITALVKPFLDTIEQENEVTYAYSGRSNNELVAWQCNPRVHFNVRFEAISDMNILYTVEKGEK